MQFFAQCRWLFQPSVHKIFPKIGTSQLVATKNLQSCYFRKISLVMISKLPPCIFYSLVLILLSAVTPASSILYFTAILWRSHLSFSFSRLNSFFCAAISYKIHFLTFSCVGHHFVGMLQFVRCGLVQILYQVVKCLRQFQWALPSGELTRLQCPSVLL